MSSQNWRSVSGFQRHMTLKPTSSFRRSSLRSSRRATITPRTSASTTPSYAPSEVLGEIGRLASFVIEKPATARRLPRRRTAVRTNCSNPAMSPS
jgi:hypothetical protein